MPAYDSAGFSPPAPVAQVRIRNPRTGAVSSAVGVLLDTGADVSCLPAAVLREVGLQPTENATVQAFGSAPAAWPAVVAEVLFGQRAFRGLWLEVDEERGILGRDVLNSLTIVLDGPRQEWAERGS